MKPRSEASRRIWRSRSSPQSRADRGRVDEQRCELAPGGVALDEAEAGDIGAGVSDPHPAGSAFRCVEGQLYSAGFEEGS